MYEIVMAFVVLGFVVFVHELGHFIVARLCRVRVDVFSIGFGPRLTGFTRGATDYRLSAFPWGGYVKLAGEQFEEGRTMAPDEFYAKPALQRTAVLLAGATGNFILAIVLLTGIYYIGYMDTAWPTKIGVVSDSSPAQAAGLLPGDRVLAVDGAPVADWQEMVGVVAGTYSSAVRVQVARDSMTLEVTVNIPEDVEQFPTIVGLWPEFPPVVGGVSDSFPAALAGLQRGDRILVIGDTPVHSWLEMQRAIAGTGRQEVRIIAERAGETLALVMRPRYVPEANVTLIGVTMWSEEKLKRFPFPECLLQALRKTTEMTRQSIVGLYKLITLQLNLTAMGGPVMIITATARMAELGLREVALFVAFISISLGVINLFPLPPTDGGHILLIILEKLRRRRLSQPVHEWVQMAGVYFVLGLFAVVCYNDMARFGWLQWVKEWVIRSNF